MAILTGLGATITAVIPLEERDLFGELAGYLP